MTATELEDELREMDDVALVTSGWLWTQLGNDAIAKANHMNRARYCLIRANAAKAEEKRRDAERN